MAELAQSTKQPSPHGNFPIKHGHTPSNPTRAFSNPTRALPNQTRALSINLRSTMSHGARAPPSTFRSSRFQPGASSLLNILTLLTICFQPGGVGLGRRLQEGLVYGPGPACLLRRRGGAASVRRAAWGAAAVGLVGSRRGQLAELRTEQRAVVGRRDPLGRGGAQRAARERPARLSHFRVELERAVRLSPCVRVLCVCGCFKYITPLLFLPYRPKPFILVQVLPSTRE